MYTHGNTYLQENVNTVYKESNWKKVLKFQDKTVTLFFFISEDRNIKCKPPELAFYEFISVCYIHTESKTVHRASGTAGSNKESRHAPLSFSLTQTRLAHIHINVQYVTVIELCLSLIKTIYEAQPPYKSFNFHLSSLPVSLQLKNSSWVGMKIQLSLDECKSQV